MKVSSILGVLTGLLVASDATYITERDLAYRDLAYRHLVYRDLEHRGLLPKAGGRPATKPAAGPGGKGGGGKAPAAGGPHGTPEYDMIAKAKQVLPGDHAFIWDKRATGQSQFGPPMDAIIQSHGGVEHRSIVLGRVSQAPSKTMDFNGFVCDLGFAGTPKGKTQQAIESTQVIIQCKPFRPSSAPSGLTYRGKVTLPKVLSANALQTTGE